MDLDAQLLDRYARTRDADAFTQLVRRHAGMVFAVARRVTQDHHDAEEVAQGCFMELARQPAAIHGSLAGWLHRVATNRATDFNRINGRRRHYERAAARPEAQTPADWDNVAPLVDAALAELPEDIRLPMVLYHFQGRNQYEVAAELGVSQTTISRRLEEGVAALREKLKAAGLMVPNAALPALLNQHAMEAVPKTLMTMLGKVAVSGFAPDASGAAAGASGGGGGGGGGSVGGATMASGASSVAAKSTALLGLKVIAAVLITAAVTTTGVTLLPKQQPVVALSVGEANRNTANDASMSDELKQVLERIKTETAQGVGEGVFILTETRIKAKNPQPRTSRPWVLKLYAQQGKSQFYMRYEVGPNGDWGNPKLTLPAGWPTPSFDETLRFAYQLQTPNLQVTNGQMWWHTQTKDNQEPTLLSSPVDENSLDRPPIISLVNDYFLPDPNELKAASRGDGLGSIDLVRRPQSPSLLGLHIFLRRKIDAKVIPFLEDTFWLDTERNDVIVEEDVQNYDASGEKQHIPKSYKYLEYAQWSDGRWYPTHWRQYADWGGMDYRLSVFPGQTLDSKWFGGPTARFASEPGNAILNALPKPVAAIARTITTDVPKAIAATATTAYHSAWRWWPWAVAAGVLGAAAVLFLRQRRHQALASPPRGVYGSRRRK